MTTRAERAAAVEQLEKALRANDGSEKNVHIREALQLLRIADSQRATEMEN